MGCDDPGAPDEDVDIIVDVAVPAEDPVGPACEDAGEQDRWLFKVGAEAEEGISDRLKRATRDEIAS